MSDDRNNEELLRSTGLQNARSIFAARQRARRDLLETQERLRASEARFRSVVEGALHGIIIQQDDRIVYANPAMARKFGYSHASELIGLDPFHDLIAEEEMAPFRIRTERAMNGEAIVPHPGWRGRHKEGRLLWISSSAHASEWNGKPAVTSFYKDITETKIAEQTLLESMGLYRAALGAGKMGAWETDFVAGTRTWTEEGMDLFGISLPEGRGQVGGDSDEYALAIHPDDRHLIADYHD